MNVLGHSNLEVFPARFTQSPWGRWLITPTYHALHHARYRGHYGLFTQCLDRAFETVWPDYERVQQRAASARDSRRCTNGSERLIVGAHREPRGILVSGCPARSRRPAPQCNSW